MLICAIGQISVHFANISPRVYSLCAKSFSDAHVRVISEGSCDTEDWSDDDDEDHRNTFIHIEN